MSFITVAQLDELTDDIPLAAEIPASAGLDDDLEVVIVRHDGKLYALENECSHAKVELSEGDVEDGTIECYLHGAAFDLATGQPKSLPATTPVRVFPVRIEGDEIQVDPTITTQDF